MTTGIALEVTRRLGGEWHGSYGVAPGPGHSKGDRSLSIIQHPNNPDDVILHSFAGDDWKAIKEELRRDGKLPAKDFYRVSKPAAMPRYAETVSHGAAHKAERQRIARSLWQKRQPADGTLVETYLRWRGLEISPLPATLGHLPANPPRYPYAAMIAGFGLADEPEPDRLVLGDGGVQSVHLTFLARDGRSKAPIEKPRKMIGTCKGLPIVLAPPNNQLAISICEGIETALTAHQVSGMGAWAAASAGFMSALAPIVPDYIESITIPAEADPAGQSGAIELAERLAARGFEVLLAGGCNGA
jgi:hypothetical protein